MTIERKGPLNGIRVLELANIGPLQHAGMILADLGAEVLRLERKTHVDAGSGSRGRTTPFSLLDRGRRSAGIDLKHPGAAALVARLVDARRRAHRGVPPRRRRASRRRPRRALRAQPAPRLRPDDRLGTGRSARRRRRPRHQLHRARRGPGAHRTARRPAGAAAQPVGDFGGGSMLLVVGVLAALVERSVSGRGQVVDAAMVDGSAMLMSIFHVFDQLGGDHVGRRAAPTCSTAGRTSMASTSAPTAST